MNNNLLPWLVALPDSVGDSVLATVLLERIAQYLNYKPRLHLLCANALTPLLSDLRGIASAIAYGPSACVEVAAMQYEWVIDLWSTKTSRHALQSATSSQQAFRSLHDPFQMRVGDSIFPAPVFNPASGGRAANPDEPAWALEAPLVAKVIGENLWDWVDGGTEPELHFRSKYAAADHEHTQKAPYAVLIPCGHPSKHWPTASFLDLGRKLKQLGLEVHISLGPDELNLNAWKGWKADGFIIQPPMNLRMLAKYLSEAHLVVANDCGPMHIACACGVPTIGIFGPSNPRSWFCYGGSHRRWIRTGKEPDPWARWNNGMKWRDWPSVDHVYSLAEEVLQVSSQNSDS